MNTSLTFEEIAEEYGLNRRTINRINHGYTHKQLDLNYPLRNTLKEINQKSLCVDCGIIISNGAQRCDYCNRIYQRKVERPSREKLKQLIRSLPFTQIGKQYGVTDNAIRKWCKNYNLPSKTKDIKQISNENWEKI